MKAVIFPAILILFLGCSSEHRESSSPVPFSSHQLPSNPVARIKMCGNGVVENKEECDGGSCCTKNCKLIPAHWNIVCDGIAGTTCSGTSSTCATNEVASAYPNVKMYDPALGVVPQ